MGHFWLFGSVMVVFGRIGSLLDSVGHFWSVWFVLVY